MKSPRAEAHPARMNIMRFHVTIKNSPESIRGALKNIHMKLTRPGVHSAFMNIGYLVCQMFHLAIKKSLNEH
jgi:hypothetical protein